MRESRTYGSVRGACDETHVPTATEATRFHHAAQRAAARQGVAMPDIRAMCAIGRRGQLGLDGACRGKARRALNTPRTSIVSSS